MGLGFGNTATTPSSPYQQRVTRADVVRSYPTKASLQINPGDHMYWDSGDAAAVPASYVNWDTDIATTRSNSSPVYLGVALGQKNAADPTTRSIEIVVKGEATYPCTATSGALDPGTYVGLAADGTHNMKDQTVNNAAVAQAGAIGKTSQYAASGATQLIFEFQSTLLYGKIQAAS